MGYRQFGQFLFLPQFVFRYNKSGVLMLSQKTPKLIGVKMVALFCIFSQNSEFSGK